MPDIMSILMQNPQLMQALGLGGGAGGSGADPLAAFRSGAPPNMSGGMPGQIGGMPGVGPPASAAPPLPGAGPGLAGAPGGVGPHTGAGGGMTVGSAPGPMANPAGMGTPLAGASSQPAAPNNQEPTGESPNQRSPLNALPHFPRNRFGAMLLPQGGQVGGSSGAPPSPSGAFDWQKILGQFLQRRNAGMPPNMAGGMPGSIGAMGGQSPTVSGM